MGDSSSTALFSHKGRLNSVVYRRERKMAEERGEAEGSSDFVR